MATKIKNYMPLLALASPPGANRTILEWVPFPRGLNIGDLIEKHNQTCYAYFREIGWDDEQIEAYVLGITVVHDSLSNLRDLRRKTLEQIDIVIIDLGAVSKVRYELPKFATKLAVRRRPFHISQVAISSVVSSTLPYFDALPRIPSRPPILYNQSELESYLEGFYIVHAKAIKSIQTPPPQPPGSGPLDVRFDILGNELSDFVKTSLGRKRILNLASDLRDATLLRNLSEKQMGDLARLLVTQEYQLSSLSKQIELELGTHVGITGLNSVRKPILQLDAQQYNVLPQLKTTEFLCLSLADDTEKLTHGQKSALAHIGITNDQPAVVQFNKKAMRSLLYKVSDQVTVTEFKGKILDW